MNEQVKAIFQENHLGVLATLNEDGSPRATPIHLVSDNQFVYWFSSEQTVHSENIVRDSRASIALFSPDTSKGPEGVYLHGKVEQLDDNERQEARDIFVGRLGSMPPVFENWSAYRLSIGTLDEQKSTGSCWYFYS